MRVLFRSGILLMILLVAACASGASLQTMRSSVPRVPVEKGRIFFYRGNAAGGVGMLPVVMLNGQKTGNAERGSVFYRDVPPGHYRVEVMIDLAHPTEFDLAAGQTVYIKNRVVVGGMEVINVEPDLGQKETAGLSLIDGN